MGGAAAGVVNRVVAGAEAGVAAAAQWGGECIENNANEKKVEDKEEL
jgi:hypothetical protein